jgi:hypothetical protein
LHRLGRGCSSSTGAPTLNIQDLIRGRTSRLQRVEHRTPGAILPLSKCLNLIHQ